MTVLQVPALNLDYPTLGPAVADFIESVCVFGPGSRQDEPAELDDEKRALLYRFYEVMPRDHKFAGQRRFHRCAIEVRKGLAKTEFAGWVAFAELHPDGPVRCDGWDANGNPVGRPVNSPYIPMMARTEEQVEELAFGVLKYVAEHSPDADLFDIGKERIIRLDPRGRADGFATPVSNAPGARDGARTTFQHFDEPHRLILPRDLHTHETMIQNLGKRHIEDPWSLYTSTAGQPGQNSIEEQVRKEAEQIEAGKRENPRLFFFARWAGEKHDDLSTVENRVAAIAEATGPIGEWGKGQFERIAEDYDREGCDRAYWERVNLNRWRKSGSQAFDMVKIAQLIGEPEIETGSFVTLGFDGARFRDATGFVITDIMTGTQQTVALWEKPLDSGDDWEIDKLDVHATLHWIMDNYEVWQGYFDPPHWTETVATWGARWPDQIVEWWTNRPRPMSSAVRAYQEAIDSGLVTYADNRYRDDLVRHLGNSGRKELRQMDDAGVPLAVLQKMEGRPEDRIDLAMAAVLSWQCCIDARRVGASPRPKVGMPVRLY